MASVHVENIASQTTEKEVRDFFSFCGKIQSLSVTPTAGGTQSATVTFEKETAAKTALLLDNTQLGPAQVKVTAAKSFDELAGGKASPEGGEAGKEEHNIPQEDKPRGRIVAEYLAHGYVISDKAIERALELDKQHGVSNRFTSALKSFDERYKASEKAAAVDTKYAISQKAGAGWRSLNSYFDKALGTPTGQKLRQFYEQGNKQVVDVHNEARHLADLKKQQQAQGAQSATGETKIPTAEEAELEIVPGTDKTKCNCSSVAGKCPCEPGKCACAGCAKSTETAAASAAATSEKPAASA
ncbi:putative actin cytoskeleton protein [Lasiodiplodia theobromae]|uniref:Protein vip1 n=1 Tax=Lasiodiplodia theobromae TaxID=45133 RepID=A0A5N5DGT1_9PEZI|nr:Actin cytoskeleton protein [Lasiodiplodia theobromae]KAB2576897.1 Protein vip1 [Lasiodiplodia theobromae]KAF4543652.1 Actin cytoskeleton protein [Lasiodiplodia theobromae]KAF9631386.1 putative actin cytoskeleton protein [Lasiodiplodia theobromae]